MRSGAGGRRVATGSADRHAPGFSQPMATTLTRLRRTKDIRAVFAAGRVAHGRAMVVHALERSDDHPARWTTIAGRKVGNAVVRNRAKRRLRAVVGETALPAGRDIVVVARQAAVGRPIDEVRMEFRGLIAQAAGRAVRAGGGDRQ